MLFAPWQRHFTDTGPMHNHPDPPPSISVSTTTTPTQYRVVAVVVHGTFSGDVSVSAEGASSERVRLLPSLLISGHAAPQRLNTYAARRRTPLFAQPTRRDVEVVGFAPAGAVLRGGPPSSEGWIALDDDETWVLNDDAIARVSDDRPQPFRRRIELPVDADVERSTARPLGAGLVVLVPRKRPSAQGKTASRAAESTMAPPPPPPPLSPPSPPPPPPPPASPIRLASEATPANASGGLARQLSAESVAALARLDDIEEQVARMSAATDQLSVALDKAARGSASDEAADTLDRSLRTQIALLHGDANKLLACQLDAVLVSDLDSGKADARAKRKALTRKAEAIIERLEAEVRRFDEIRRMCVTVSEDTAASSSSDDDEDEDVAMA